MWLTIFVVLVVLGTSSAVYIPRCKPGGFEWLRDPDDCSTHWRCVFGSPVFMGKCGAGTILHSRLHVCVHRGGRLDDCNSNPGRLSVAERCARGDTTFAHESECQLFYNCSKVYKHVPRFFEQYLDECIYPDLFDAASGTCKSFTEVRCGRKLEQKNPCSYRRSWCPVAHCMPCEVSSPSCIGKTDGMNTFTNREWSPYYIVCNRDRTIGTDKCSKDETLNMARFFSPETKKCEPLYRIPRSRGGLAPSCSVDGLLPTNTCDVFIRCQGKIVAEVVKCPTETVFDPVIKGCRPDTQFCGKCGRACKDLPGRT